MSEATLFHQKEDQRKVWIAMLCSPWSRVPEKFTGFHLIKKLPPFNGTRKFITALTSARHPPPWNWDRSSGQQESDLFSWPAVPATGLRGKYFLLTVGVMKVANHMITRFAARTTHKKATTPCVNFPCSSWVHYYFSFTGCIYHGSSFLWGDNFHFCCGTAVSFMFVT
jgi:hypothetical protein